MHNNADRDDVNQHNKLSVELNDYHDFIFANKYQMQSNDNASSSSSFANEADEMEVYDIEDIEYHVPDPANNYFGRQYYWLLSISQDIACTSGYWIRSHFD